ncbi:MAG: hypothetical protein COV35_00680 [Alphaproteobacteria bacterium CG11_big_fil_rev_8_21_14_0_20_39_49]|nr:MAG: hypothetical protein COV35_00680 [Alphaproteobacteria bacterium CG11_big_fil_rev_8_21_14_0_20_39_49]
MTNFIKDILKTKSEKEPDKSQQHGYYMMQAETSIESVNTDRFIKFYAVPEKMRNNVEKDSSLLLTSANIHNLYSVEKSKYEDNPEKHNSNAETEFSSYQQMQHDHAEHLFNQYQSGMKR